MRPSAPERLRPKANGAGIAADPTLTGPWACLLANLPTSAWRPMFPWSPPKRFPVLSPALAPASGFARGLAGPKTAPSSGETETEPSLMAFHLKRYPRLPKLSRIPSMQDRIARPIVKPLSRYSQAARLPPAEAFVMRSSNSARKCSAITSGSKKFFVFKSFDCHSKSFSFPSDVLRLRSRSESHKLCKMDLSTFPRFCGGQGWITQRSVACHHG